MQRRNFVLIFDSFDIEIQSCMQVVSIFCQEFSLHTNHFTNKYTLMTIIIRYRSCFRIGLPHKCYTYFIYIREDV